MTGPMWRMNQAEMRQAVAAELVADPSRSNRRIADKLRVSHYLVGSVRDDLETGGQIAKLTKTVSADGRSRTARRTSDAKPKPVKVRNGPETGGQIAKLARTVSVVRDDPEPAEALVPRGRLALSVAETAQALGVSRALVHQACQSGQLHSVTVGKRRIIPVASLRAWLDS